MEIKLKIIPYSLFFFVFFAFNFTGYCIEDYICAGEGCVRLDGINIGWWAKNKAFALHTIASLSFVYIQKIRV